MKENAAMKTPKGNGSASPIVVDARGVNKTFRIPEHRIDSLKERAVHPLRRSEYRELKALRDISFEIRGGEFFGIVGRNGSGKSTLLKILASIYRADAGSIRMAGRVAPFIELGVGFNPDLTARDNVQLNGVMMGLSRQEALRRLDSVLDFAELEDFAELKLKNYSSGMMVRLAFATMLQGDADIMLIDEVLAVGDAAFQQKCADVFRGMRDSDKTVVLVTHDMGAIDTYCDRAMLIDSGEITRIGDPRDVAGDYLKLNFGGITTGDSDERVGVPELHSMLIDSWLENEEGVRIDNLEIGEPIRLTIELEASSELDRPIFGLQFNNADGLTIIEFNDEHQDAATKQSRVKAGERFRVSVTLANQLVPGRYFVRCFAVRHRERNVVGLQPIDALDFVVYGMPDGAGVINVSSEISVETGSGDPK
jgi:ABC-2 type transport system ATP-binding protein